MNISKYCSQDLEQHVDFMADLLKLHPADPELPTPSIQNLIVSKILVTTGNLRTVLYSLKHASCMKDIKMVQSIEDNSASLTSLQKEDMYKDKQFSRLCI